MREPSRPVPLTAYLTAVARRDATNDPRIGLADPYAARFAERCPAGLLRMARQTAGLRVLAERTQIIDSLLTEIVSVMNVATILNLGAGFDARPYRLQFGHPVRFVEVDLADVLEEKERLLPSSDCPVPLERVGCDLTDPTQAQHAVARACAGAATLVLSEGLLAYLAPPALRRLAGTLARAGALAWVCDVMGTGSAAALARAAQAGTGTRMPIYGCDDLSPFEDSGWQCITYRLLQTARPPAALTPREHQGAASHHVLDGVLHLVPARAGVTSSPGWPAGAGRPALP